MDVNIDNDDEEEEEEENMGFRDGLDIQWRRREKQKKEEQKRVLDIQLHELMVGIPNSSGGGRVYTASGGNIFFLQSKREDVIKELRIERTNK